MGLALALLYEGQKYLCMTMETIRHNINHPSGEVLAIEARIRRAIMDVAPGDSPVLIAGEPGVGKSAIAAEIHRRSRDAQEPYVEISGAGCTSQLLMSVLSTRGTIYLCDVADLSTDLQSLIVANYFHGKQLQGRLLGGTAFELIEHVKTHRMREDFYHLISTVTLRVSPLRFRRSDILPIAERLLLHYSSQFDRPMPVLGKDITDYLLGHTWPGNLTELETAIKTFVIIGDRSISLHALKAASAAGRHSGSHRQVSLKTAARAASNEVERQLITQVLVATGGNRKRAADELGISYKALLYKLKQVEASSKVSLTEGGCER
jgi:two-component system response regulator AtoC